MESATAFCPGHVSCVFQPISSYNPMSIGSRGFGIRLSLGAHAKVVPREDGIVRISLDGVESEAQVTRMAVDAIAPGMGFDISIENDVPVSQGFGMSAAGSIAAAVCVANLVGESRTAAFAAAHMAEVKGGGGLGDVAAIVAGNDIPIRTMPGFPPYGRVISARFSFPELTLAVLGPVIKTGSVLKDNEKVALIREVSSEAIDEFLADPTYDSMFPLSNRFSSEAELESPLIRKTIDRLMSRGYHAGMCMLGNSIFTDAPESEVWSVLGRGHVRTFACSSSYKEILVTRRG